ncbi:hypothetical protein V5799_021012 [Amblyomma americanum]|uniref:CoA carboxyltransferase N-terminal domain-containing protein n=1 Tax=Amblyomma americanum TaxID=6943 RepID=A0AAQ4FPR1_AMBAM
MVMRYGPRLWKLRVLQAEIKMTIRPSLNGKCVPIRLFLANESGYYLDIALYKERLDPETGLMQFEAWGPHRQGPLHGLPISTPYLTKDYLQQKRFQAQSNGTTYVYDFPDMFRQVGMVAWRMTLVTPENPEGRDIIVIANDITFLLGTFGPQEDILFLKASERARALGIPRLYISANSGARIGLAEELKHLFNIAWVDPEVPDKGYRYLYLTPENFKKVSALNSVNTELIDDEGEKRYKITSIIGKVDGLGVENLKYAGLIAGETSQAYEEIVTISLLLGREVYTSNNQLGGVQIMYPNGVSHVTVHDDLEGTYVMLKWLSYMPKPVLVYIPPYGELRGGAWAVVDAAINPQQMEMYADPDSRGGVLEPEGTVEIRFRKKDLLKAMHRVDARCREILAQLGMADPEKKAALEVELHKREQQLLPMYHQVALSFADLHDMPARMQEKGVIQVGSAPFSSAWVLHRSAELCSLLTLAVQKRQTSLT